jgi:surface antigen
MKLFHIIALINLLFLANCSGLIGTLETKPVETPSEGFITKMPKLDFSKRWSGQVGSRWNGMQYVGFVYLLSKEDRLLHRATVQFVLDELPDMKIATWYSRKEKAMGKVRAVHSLPKSAGYCRYYQVLIQVNKKARAAVYQACKSMEYHWRYDYGAYRGKTY